MEEKRALEINVCDLISVCDTLEQAEQVVLEFIRRWYVSGDNKPLTITIKKIESRGPPVVKINVADVMKVQGAMV